VTSTIRPQPPSADYGEPTYSSRGDLNRSGPPEGRRGGDKSWLRLAQEAYDFATSYVDTNYRKTWEDSLRAFNSQHPTDSKYNSAPYDKRSKLFRPKTRALIRKNEAAAAAAFFSNMDVVSIEAENQNDTKERAAAQVMKHLLQYRLTKKEKGVPWFQIVLGGIQDAQTVGAAVAHVYWDYTVQDKEPAKPIPFEDGEKSGSDSGEEIVTADRPCVDLVPIENFLFDPAASWIDPVGTSPYIIHLMPMFAQDVKGKINDGEWEDVDESMFHSAMSSKPDRTTAARTNQKEDPKENEGRTIDNYNVVWVQRHIHKINGVDWEWYTLGTVAMLTKPKPLRARVFHGERPYVMGVCNIETHNPMPSPIPKLAQGLQSETNEIANQRIDNIKLVLNKRFIAKRGRDIDYSSLIRNVPGSITLVNDPETDVKPLEFPDITGSSYAEQDRINADMDELLGNFSAGSVLQNHQAMESPAKTLGLVSSGATIMTEYLIRTYVTTFIEPILRQLMKLEQHYETDTVVLALAGEKAKLHQHYGIDQVTDDLLDKELTLTVNVGMGATDPTSKLQKFIAGITTFSQLSLKPPPGINLTEVGKEIFGHLGYQDGSRFFNDEDPQKKQLQVQLQAASQMVQDLQKQLKEKQMGHVLSYKGKEVTAQARVAAEAHKQQNENARVQLLHSKTIPEDPRLKQAALLAELKLEREIAEQKLRDEMTINLKKIEQDFVAKMAQVEVNRKVKEKEAEINSAHKDKDREAKSAEQPKAAESKPQPINVNITNVIPKPGDKTVKLTKGKDGQIQVDVKRKDAD